MSGRIFSCGANSWGQLGLGHVDDRNEPCLVEMLRNVRVHHLDCGSAHTVVVCDGRRSNGTSDERHEPIKLPDGLGVYGFGRNKEGQLGFFDPARTCVQDQIQMQPIKLISFDKYLLEDMAGFELRCGGYHTAVLVEKREKLLTFGQNCFGQLGLGHTTDGFSPQQVHLPVTGPIKTFACGGGHTVVVMESKQVLAFGRNNLGQLGVGELEHKHHPVVVAELCDKNIVQVQCGSKHTMVLARSNVTDQLEMYAFGRNREGQLGADDVVLEHYPTRVLQSEPFLGCAGGNGYLSVGKFSSHCFFVPRL